MSNKLDPLDIRVLVVPGLSGSPSNHWQSVWERQHPHYQRVEQANWDRPTPEEWIPAFERAVATARSPAIVVAHSLGCALVAHWLARGSAYSDRLRGALLVAPPDVQSGRSELEGFAPLPRVRASLPLWVVASGNDPYATLAFSRSLVDLWGAELFEVGNLGHINVASGHGPWPQGAALLSALSDQVKEATFAQEQKGRPKFDARLGGAG